MTETPQQVADGYRAAMKLTEEMFKAADAERKKHGMSYQAYFVPPHELRAILEAALSSAPNTSEPFAGLPEKHQPRTVSR